MPISATLGVSLVGRRDERRGGWEEHQENPADWAFLLSWASYKTSARLDTNRSGSLRFIRMANPIFIHIGYIYTRERREHPITSAEPILCSPAISFLISIQFNWTGAKALLTTSRSQERYKSTVPLVYWPILALTTFFNFLGPLKAPCGVFDL